MRRKCKLLPASVSCKVNFCDSIHLVGLVANFLSSNLKEVARVHRAQVSKTEPSFTAGTSGAIKISVGGQEMPNTV